MKHIDSITNNNGAVLFTQPLSEDEYITEEHKIYLYTAICEKVSKYGDVIVKLHPRDTSDYRFKNALYVLEAGYPSELLLLFPIKFAIGIGICTSAVISCNADKGINLCNDYLKSLDDDFLNQIDSLIN